VIGFLTQETPSGQFDYQMDEGFLGFAEQEESKTYSHEDEQKLVQVECMNTSVRMIPWQIQYCCAGR
jgi:hypothetical protein